MLNIDFSYHPFLALILFETADGLFRLQENLPYCRTLVLEMYSPMFYHITALHHEQDYEQCPELLAHLLEDSRARVGEPDSAAALKKKSGTICFHNVFF